MSMKLHNRHIRQQGAALITSLVILLILTVLGVSAMSTSSLEEYMAGNLRDKVVSFQAAETGLRDAERTITGFGAPPPPTSTGANSGIYERDTFGDFATTAFDASVWPAAATEYGTAGAVNLSGVAEDPFYIIEEYQFISKDASLQSQMTGQGKIYYRITSRGVGLSPNAVTLLQETTAKRFK
jgi:type IV pilus assembly protein PilX